MRQKGLTLLEMQADPSFSPAVYIKESLVGGFFSHPYRQSTVKGCLVITTVALYPSVGQEQ